MKTRMWIGVVIATAFVCACAERLSAPTEGSLVTGTWGGQGILRVMAANSAYDLRVAGAVSPQPGVVLGEPGPGKILVAQSGRARIKADARYGAIRAGDLLVTIPKKGYAMRSKPVRVGEASMHRPGTVLGKALEPLSTRTGEILVLLTLQ